MRGVAGGGGVEGGRKRGGEGEEDVGQREGGGQEPRGTAHCLGEKRMRRAGPGLRGSLQTLRTCRSAIRDIVNTHGASEREFTRVISELHCDYPPPPLPPSDK